MRPDRVVIINDRSAEIGGASNLACLLSRLLCEAGIPVTFFSGDRAAAAGRIGLGSVPLTEQTPLSAFATGLYNRQAGAALSSLIERFDTPETIYHLHGWSKILSPAVFRALSQVRRRVVLHAHDYFLVCPNGGFIDFPRASVCGLAPMSAGCLTRQCDKRGFHHKLWRTARLAIAQRFFDLQRKPANIILIHDRMRDYFRRAGVDETRLTTIRNPVVPFLDRPAAPWRQQAFLFVGRLEPEKGFEDAAAAARIAGVRLEMIGEGAGRQRLVETYPEVVLHGWLTKAEIATRMQSARALVVSSRVPEPFGLAALEAAGSGIPVLLPSAALLSAEMEAAGAALTFPTANVAALAASMRLLAGDGQRVRAMSRAAYGVAPKLAHTEQSWVDAILALYGEVLVRAASSETFRRRPASPRILANTFGE